MFAIVYSSTLQCLVSMKTNTSSNIMILLGQHQIISIEEK